MRLETSGDNPFTTSAVYWGGRASVLSNSVRPVPQIQGVHAYGTHHALGAEGWHQHVFHLHARCCTPMGHSIQCRG